MKPETKVEPVVRILLVMIVFYTLALFVAAKFFAEDGQLFQVVSNVLSGFVGAILMRIKPKGADPAEPVSMSTTTTREGGLTGQPSTTMKTVVGTQVEPVKEAMNG